VNVTAEDVVEIERRAYEIMVTANYRPDLLPDRICERPADGRSHLCPFIDTCFAGWEPPELEELPPELAAILPKLHSAELAYKNLSKLTALAEESRNELRDEALQAGLETGEHEANGVSVRLTEVAGRETFSLSTARKAGQWTEYDEERLGPFVNLGRPSYRWTVKGTEEPEPAGPVDYGEVPF
jgi:hypothetical protein